jgi:hypothetical protein
VAQELLWSVDNHKRKRKNSRNERQQSNQHKKNSISRVCEQAVHDGMGLFPQVVDSVAADPDNGVVAPSPVAGSGG